MATDLPELERFRRFVDERIAQGRRELSVVDAVAECEAFEAEAARLQAQLQESIEQANRGEAAPLDADTLKNAIRAKLANEGIGE